MLLKCITAATAARPHLTMEPSLLPSRHIPLLPKVASVPYHSLSAQSRSHLSTLYLKSPFFHFLVSKHTLLIGENEKEQILYFKDGTKSPNVANYNVML